MGRFRARDLFVFDDLDGLFLASRAFKGALIVVWRLDGLNTDEPHLSVTRFATGEAHRPRLPNYLKRSHVTRPRLPLFIFSTAQSNAALKKYIDNEKNSHGTAGSLETILGRPHYFNSRWTPVPVPLQIWRHGEVRSKGCRVPPRQPLFFCAPANGLVRLRHGW